MERVRSPLGEWTCALSNPPPPLSRYVEALVAVESRCGFQELKSLPKPAVELFINLTDSRSAFRGARSWVSGAREELLTLEVAPVQSFVAIRFRPSGARAFLGIPASRFVNRVVPAGDLGARSTFVDRARDWMLEVADPGERLRLLLSELEALMSSVHECEPWLYPAIAAELTTRGQISVRELCRKLGVSRRRLVGGFVREVGLTPKRFMRLLRFHQAFRLVMESQQGLADIALDCGYHDQPHFTNEFRQLAGQPPARLRASVAHQIDGIRFVSK